MQTDEIRVGDRYRSNGGAGPLTAVVVALTPLGNVRMYRYLTDRARVYFTLTERYMRSPRCGWRKIRAQE